MDIITLFQKNKSIQEWNESLATRDRQLLMGLSLSSKAIAIASAYKSSKTPILIVTHSQNEAEKLASDLSSLIGEDNVYQFFADDVAAAEFIFSSLDRAVSRLNALNFLQ